MVHRRSGAGRIASGQVHDDDDDDGMLSQENAIELHPEGSATPPARKRRRDGREAPKKRRRGEKGGLCQLNFDELYIVRGYPFVMVSPVLTACNDRFSHISILWTF